MTINPFSTELAAEHRRALLQDAAEYRRAKAARPARRAARASMFRLRVRPIRPEDAPLLADVFDRLGPSSRLNRFLTRKGQLTAVELRHFTDIDHHNHEALIAITRFHGEPVGVARFIRDPDDPTSAEVAMEVIDEWQHRGVGSMLAARLMARAQCEDVSQVTATMSADNTRARRLLVKLGSHNVVARNGATVSYRVALPSVAPAPTPRFRAPSAFTGCAS